MIISKTETHIVVAVKIAKATLFRNVRFNSTRVLRLPTGPGCRLCGSPATRVFPLRAPIPDAELAAVIARVEPLAPVCQSGD